MAQITEEHKIIIVADDAAEADAVVIDLTDNANYNYQRTDDPDGVTFTLTRTIDSGTKEF